MHTQHPTAWQHVMLQLLGVLLDQIGDEPVRGYVPDDATIEMFVEAHAMALKLMPELTGGS